MAPLRRIASAYDERTTKRETLAFFLGMERMLSDQALKQGRLGDALAHTGDEGRSTLRKAAARGEHSLTRRSPNRETDPGLSGISSTESIGRRSKRGELKHLSTRRKGHQ